MHRHHDPKDSFRSHWGDFLDAITDAAIAAGDMCRDAWGMLTAPAPKPQEAVNMEVAADADHAMDLALAVLLSEPANNAHDGRPFTKAVSDFMAAHYQTEGVDLTGAYGPQSPDLITAYIREFQPGWMYKVGTARDLWTFPGAMPAGWEQVGVPARGDIAVIEASEREPFGNLGVVSQVFGRTSYTVSIQVLTQITSPRNRVDFMQYPADVVRGYFRWVGVPVGAAND
jgi:hypothetical protein